MRHPRPLCRRVIDYCHGRNYQANLNLELPKRYQFTTLGTTTDTQDRTGNVTERKNIPL